MYSDEFVRQLYTNPENLVLHDFAFIKAVRSLLEHKKCQWHFLQMVSVFEIFNQWSIFKPKTFKFHDLTARETSFFKPSFYQVLWNNNIKEQERKLQKRYAYYDLHPSPLEHLSYLTKTFEHDWQPTTVTRINQLEVQHDSIFKVLVDDKDVDDHVFDHMRNPDHLPKIF